MASFIDSLFRRNRTPSPAAPRTTGQQAAPAAPAASPPSTAAAGVDDPPVASSESPNSAGNTAVGSPGLVEFFSQDHRDCDTGWAELEDKLASEAPDAADAWTAFDGAMRRHLSMEEELLFPAFEQATGMTGGPTAMMRMEHEQMRALLDDMDRAMSAGDLQGVLDRGDTLLMLIQQHNMKEEGMLYPMASQALAAEWPALAARLDQVS